MGTPKPVVDIDGGYKVPRASAPVDLHLDANEGIPPADSVLGAIESTTALARYPKREELAERLAGFAGVSEDCVFVTNGGDDAIDRLCRAFLDSERSLVVPTPSFEMIERYGALQGAEIRRVPWGDDEFFPKDACLDAIDATTGMVAIVTPNNPTGCVARTADIVEIATAYPETLIMVDLAYIEFADEDPTPELVELENVAMIRTMSKAWGLAGLRVGYCVASPEIIQTLNAVGGPYPVSSVSIAMACHALDEGTSEVASRVEMVRGERAKLAEFLDSHGFVTSNSQANFVFARGREGAWLRDACAGMGIGIRAWPGRSGLGDAIRITCPTRSDEFERLLRALEVIFEPEAILLDMDGIIADVSGSFRRAIVETAEHFGAVVGAADIADEKAKGNANNDWVLTHRLLKGRGIEVTLDEVTEHFEDLYQGRDGHPGLWRQETLIVDRAWLEKLREFRPLAVVTGRPRADAQRFVDSQELGGLFEHMICMEDADLKPSPAPLQLAAEKMGVTRFWMVGDTPDDIVAARGAAALPVGVLAPGDTDRDVLYRAGAAWVLDTTSDLLTKLPGSRDA